MRKKILHNLLVCSVLVVLLLQSCKDDSNLTKSLPVTNQSFTEEFDTLDAAKSRGWVIKNKSEPIGPQNWVQGLTGNQSNDYIAFSSTATADGFISADYLSAIDPDPGAGTISNWVISPSIILQNGDKVVFYTRCADTESEWGDRLQVLVNSKNEGTDCGSGGTTGDFSSKILDINPINAGGATDSPFPASYPIPYIFDAAMAYPFNWTRFEATINGLSKPTKGRFAFRYFVPLGGSDGRGGHISIDKVTYESVGY